MHPLFEQIVRLSTDDGFFSFQNSLAQSLYESLGQGYARNENEVALVHKFVDTANGRKHGLMRLHAAMLHGSRSYVEFNYLDRPVTKELGDMAIIGLITNGKQRLFQRICIIQNKKSIGTGWDIDLEQLFLLKNFPPFSGNKGIFKGCRDMAFRNSSGCLGAFGLMDSPGDMLFAAAPVLSNCIIGKKSVSHADLAQIAKHSSTNNENGLGGMSCWPMLAGFHPMDWFHVMEKYFHHYGFPPFMFGSPGGQAFLGNVMFLRDIYDLVRSWTQFSLGEITCVNDTVTNKTVDAFSNFLVRAAGFEGLPALPTGNLFGDREFQGQMSVFLTHLNIEM
jgi:hypothetical protein